MTSPDLIYIVRYCKDTGGQWLGIWDHVTMATLSVYSPVQGMVFKIFGR